MFLSLSVKKKDYPCDSITTNPTIRNAAPSWGGVRLCSMKQKTENLWNTSGSLACLLKGSRMTRTLLYSTDKGDIS